MTTIDHFYSPTYFPIIWEILYLAGCSIVTYLPASPYPPGLLGHKTLLHGALGAGGGARAGRGWPGGLLRGGAVVYQGDQRGQHKGGYGVFGKDVDLTLIESNYDILLERYLIKKVFYWFQTRILFSAKQIIIKKLAQ